MSVRKRRRSNVTIDTVPLPEKVLRMDMKRGRVSRARGKFFLSVSGKKIEIPAEPIVSKKDISRMVDKEVHVAFSNNKKLEIVAIGTWPTPERPRIVKHWVLCYIPAPRMMRKVENTVHKALMGHLIKEKAITTELAGQLRRDRA